MIALASASGFAVSTSLQHHAASGVDGSAGALRLLARLARTPLWLLASTLGLVSFALHAMALHLGTLALVQPLMLCGVVLAIPVRAAVNRRLPHRSDLLAATVTVLGLAVFLAATKLSAGNAVPDPRRGAGACVAALTVFLLLNVLASRRRLGHLRATLLGASAGILFGLMAGLIKYVAHDLYLIGAPATLLTWRPWVLALIGLTAVATNQRAFQAGRLAASMPVLNVVNVLVAMVFGWLVFGEAPVQGPLSLALQLLSAGVMALGLVWIARLDPDAEPASPAPPVLAAGRVPQEHP